MKWPEIEELLVKNQNWRSPNSFWGKLAKCIYNRNRAPLRAKIMQLWRKNYSVIRQKLVILNGSSETNSSNLSLLVSIKFEYLLQLQVSI